MSFLSTWFIVTTIKVRKLLANMSESEKEQQNAFKNQLLSAIGDENVDEIIELIEKGAKVH